MCVCVCVCLWVYIYIYIYIYVCVCVCGYIYIYIYIYIFFFCYTSTNKESYLVSRLWSHDGHSVIPFLQKYPQCIQFSLCISTHTHTHTHQKHKHFYWKSKHMCMCIQTCQNLFLEGHCTAEFSSNSNQTHMNQLIKLFRLTRIFQESVLELAGS